LEKLGNLDQLILSDIKDDQYFGSSEGLPYPRSLVALRLKNNGDAIGVLWVGFDQNHWFGEDDIHFYQQLAYRASAALNTKEQAVKMQSEKSWLEAAFQVLTFPVLIIHRANEVLFANTAALQLLTDETGKQLRSLKDLQSSHPGLSDALTEAGNSGEPFRLAVENGLEYEAHVLPISTQDGQSGKILLLNDTVWQKRISAQKNEFVTNISHDLLSPLQLMRGYVNLLKNIGNLSEEQEKYISRILLSIENMSGLVSKVMSMEMLDSDEEVKPINFDLKELIVEVLSMLDLQAQQRNVTLHTDFSGLRNPNIVADRVLLRQAVFNLVENAIKFNHVGGDVWISTMREAGKVRIEVKDNGKGIAPLDKPKLFTRYFHVEDGESFDSPGPGLGLSIVKSVVEKHGGNINVESKLGEGSAFTIEIPLRK
jgi:signal transduction histidine kinase